MEEIKVRPVIEIESSLLEELKTQAQEQGQVVIHFRYDSHPVMPMPDKIRIWESTYLEDKGSDLKSPLVHVENICKSPQWTVVPPMSHHFFTLIFKGLPKSVEKFDMCEYCDGDGTPFVVADIPRNDTDVYYVVIGRA